MWKRRLYKFSLWFFGIITGLFLLISLLLWIYKDDICDMAIAEINKNLKAEVQVSDVELTFWSTFPSLSIDFNHVFIQDAIVGSTMRDTLLYSDRIRCKLNPFDIWNEEYKVKSIEVGSGVLNLKVDSEGKNNYDILKTPSDSNEDDGSFDLNLEKVSLKNFRFNFVNAATSQEYRTRIHEMDFEGALSEQIFTTKATSRLKIIAAKSGNISLVNNKPAKLEIGINVNLDSGTIEIPKSTIHIASLPFNFEGNVNSDGFTFDLKGKDIGIKDAASNFAMEEVKEIKNFSGTGQLIFELGIEGKNDAQSPVEIECKFGIEDGTLRDPNSGITLTDLILDGEYSNVGGPEKEFLNLKEIAFSTSGGPFKGNLMLTHFEAPLFSGRMEGLLNLSVIRSLFKLKSMQMLNGTVVVSSEFIVQAERTETEAFDYNIKKCEGQMRMNKVNAQLVDDKRVYRNISGLVVLRNDRVGIDDISLTIGGSDFLLNGVFIDVVNYFSGRGNLLAKIDTKSQNIDLADLGSDSKADKMMHERVFVVPDNIEADVYLDVAKMKYEEHMFYNLKGNMNMINRMIHFPRVAVTNGGADIKGSLTIQERNPEMFYISSQIVSDNINFKELFKEWDNFKQDVIKSSNISGIAKANVRFEAPFDLRTGIISNAIVAQVGLEILEGKLQNVTSFREITKSLKATTSARLAIGKENINSFERKLLDLKFSKLENTFLIREGVLTIPSMSIESSALDIELSGKHTFDNKIDYRFGFRFRDLKKKEESEFGIIQDDGSGKFVFMRMYGDLDDPNIEWDKVSNKEHKKEIREVAKRDSKSILKSEFGLFKNDTTVKAYIQERRPHEILEIDLNPANEVDDLKDEFEPSKKDNKWTRWVEKVKVEAAKEKAKNAGFDLE